MLETIATKLNRIVGCNGSLSMPKFSLGVESDNSGIKDEGIAAHHLACNLNTTNDVNLIGKQAPNGVFMTEEMLASVAEYIDYIEGRSPYRFFSEMECDASHSLENYFTVNGRADNITHTCDNVLFVDEFKYGYKIVNPEMNWTLLSHAIGYCQNLGNAPMPEQFVFSIIQPRAIHHRGIIRQWIIDANSFMNYWQHLINVLSNPTNEIVTGDHCHRCPSLAFCPSATQAGYNLVEASNISFDENITNSELSELMDLLNSSIKRAKSKLEALEEIAMYKIKRGEVVENYLPETSLGNTSWLNHVTPEMIKMLTGVDVKNGKMITPTQAKKKGISKEIVEMLSHRPNRGVKLTRITADEKARKMFTQ